MKYKRGISAIVLVKNEENSLSRCLESLTFCNEILVIDDFSTDGSREIARKFQARVIKRHLRNNFAAQRNFALKKAQFEWSFFVDADEVVPYKLKKEILQIVKSTDSLVAYSIHRVDVLWGKVVRFGELGKWGAFGNAMIMRFGQTNAGIWKRAIHEQWEIQGKVGKLESELLHYPHQSMSEFIGEIGARAAIHSHSLNREGKESSLIKVVIWPTGKFFYNFFIKLGFLDGVRGFLLATIMSFHSFLSWSNLWLEKRSSQ